MRNIAEGQVKQVVDLEKRKQMKWKEKKNLSDSLNKCQISMENFL